MSARVVASAVIVSTLCASAAWLVVHGQGAWAVVFLALAMGERMGTND